MIQASRLQLAPGPWSTLLDGLCARFPHIDRATWLDRFLRGRVLDAQGGVLDAATPYRVGLEIQYFREVADEPVLDQAEAILHQDTHLLIADKPHFLPVVPSGRFVEQTLLARLIARTGIAELVPLHRIDRATAGLVMFSSNRASRSRYQALFRLHQIEKTYDAVAPALPATDFPLRRATRLVKGQPFFRMQEVPGDPNTLTHVDVIARGDRYWQYRLQPITGKQHQLRVHMAALGAGIVGDDFYPVLADNAGNDFANPLQLLARELRFVDPLSGEPRAFVSRLMLAMA